jgi:hypothetical protein
MISSEAHTSKAFVTRPTQHIGICIYSHVFGIEFSILNIYFLFAENHPFPAPSSLPAIMAKQNSPTYSAVLHVL